MTQPKGHRPTQEPNGGGHEGNANVHVENRPEWKKRPEQYPDAPEQLDIDTDKKGKCHEGSGI
jgi:hypothetical protein